MHMHTYAAENCFGDFLNWCGTVLPVYLIPARQLGYWPGSNSQVQHTSPLHGARLHAKYDTDSQHETCPFACPPLCVVVFGLPAWVLQLRAHWRFLMWYTSFMPQHLTPSNFNKMKVGVISIVAVWGQSAAAIWGPMTWRLHLQPPESSLWQHASKCSCAILTSYRTRWCACHVIWSGHWPLNIWNASSTCSSLNALRARQPSSFALLHIREDALTLCLVFLGSWAGAAERPSGQQGTPR